MDAFWVVWCEAADPPMVKHPSAESAKCEAERLARNVPGQRFVVLKAVAAVTKSDVTWERVEDDDGIPF